MARGAILAVVLVVAIAGTAIVEVRRSDEAAADLAARQDQVERNGAMVMPFDQNRTTHQFDKTGMGGVETVTANDSNDTAQAELVQGHLRHERDPVSS